MSLPVPMPCMLGSASPSSGLVGTPLQRGLARLGASGGSLLRGRRARDGGGEGASGGSLSQRLARRAAKLEAGVLNYNALEPWSPTVSLRLFPHPSTMAPILLSDEAPSHTFSQPFIPKLPNGDEGAPKSFATSKDGTNAVFQTNGLGSGGSAAGLCMPDTSAEEKQEILQSLPAVASDYHNMDPELRKYSKHADKQLFLLTVSPESVAFWKALDEYNIAYIRRMYATWFPNSNKTVEQVLSNYVPMVSFDAQFNQHTLRCKIQTSKDPNAKDAPDIMLQVEGDPQAYIDGTLSDLKRGCRGVYTIRMQALWFQNTGLCGTTLIVRSVWVPCQDSPGNERMDFGDMPMRKQPCVRDEPPSTRMDDAADAAAPDAGLPTMPPMAPMDDATVVGGYVAPL